MSETLINADVPRRRFADVGALAAVLVAQLITLRAMGRFWWCRCGSWVPWAGKGSTHNSLHLVDAYSFSHVIHGMLFYALLRWLAPRLSVGWRLVIATMIEVTWEIIENTPFVIGRYRDETGALGYAGDAIANSLADTACAVLGFAIARRLRWQTTLALAILFELGCLLWIRDNLTLNVIMLLHPFEAVREWQTAAG